MCILLFYFEFWLEKILLLLSTLVAAVFISEIFDYFLLFSFSGANGKSFSVYNTNESKNAFHYSLSHILLKVKFFFVIVFVCF